jgi:hypothetical protein
MLGPSMYDDHTQQVDELNRLAPDIGWEAALRRVFADDFLRYLDPSRAGFLELFPFEGLDVLEIGPGIGQFTSLIASKAKSVAALEVDRGQADFLAERLRQEGNTNAVSGRASCCAEATARGDGASAPAFRQPVSRHQEQVRNSLPDRETRRTYGRAALRKRSSPLVWPLASER